MEPKFILVSSSDEETFNSRVNELIGSNYEPLGGVSVACCYDRQNKVEYRIHTVYTIGMIKTSKRY